jgi:transcriptional regulator with XRE-family HTH domain
LEPKEPQITLFLLCRLHGKTGKAVAEHLHITGSLFSHICNGTRSLSPVREEAIASFLGVTAKVVRQAYEVNTRPKDQHPSSTAQEAADTLPSGKDSI